MTYTITKEIRILHNTDGWDYVFTDEEYGIVTVTCTEGLESMTGKTTSILIPKDCIQHFIKALESYK